MMRVTVSLPDDVVEGLRAKAQAEGKPLSAWLREVLTRQVEPDSSWAAKFERLADKVATNVEWTWNREETYAERLDQYPAVPRD